ASMVPSASIHHVSPGLVEHIACGRLPLCSPRRDHDRRARYRGGGRGRQRPPPRRADREQGPTNSARHPRRTSVAGSRRLARGSPCRASDGATRSRSPPEGNDEDCERGGAPPTISAVLAASPRLLVFTSSVARRSSQSAWSRA